MQYTVNPSVSWLIRLIVGWSWWAIDGLRFLVGWGRLVDRLVDRLWFLILRLRLLVCLHWSLIGLSLRVVSLPLIGDLSLVAVVVISGVGDDLCAAIRQ